MFLTDFVPVYIAKRNAERPIGRDLSPQSRRHLVETANGFSKSIGRPARVVDLSAERINAYLAKLTTDGRSAYTVKCRRTGLMILLRRAIRMRLINNVDTHDVRSVFCPQLSNDGFSQADAEKLVAASRSLVGVIYRTSIPKALYFEAAIRLLWDTGIRSGDVVGMRIRDFDRGGRVWIVERKTGKRGWRPLRNSTCEAIARCIAAGNQEREMVFSGIGRRAFWRWFGVVAKSAGLKGTTKWMRRGSSSEIDNRKPGAGWRFLKHSNPQLFEDHYRVERIAQDGTLMPPELGSDRKDGAA
jgi:integrase